MLLRAVPFIALYTLLVSGGAFAQETLVQTLSEGACWFEQGENLKVVSFNDHEAFSVPHEALYEGLSNMLMNKSKRSEMDLVLHCSGHGASLVVKTADTCAWIGFNKGQLELKSLGGLEGVKASGLCDGYKWGELLIGLNTDDETTMHLFGSYISSFTKVSTKLYRVNLKKEFWGKELLLQKDFKNMDKNIRYVDLNQFQHAVGEYTNLK